MAEKILVVDDSKLVTDIVRMRLSMYGYEVDLAHSGEEALAKVAIAVPDLMVLDVQMPGIDGYEVCRRLRDDPALDDLRINQLQYIFAICTIEVTRLGLRREGYMFNAHITGGYWPFQA